jgi:hypothetical protein
LELLQDVSISTLKFAEDSCLDREKKQMFAYQALKKNRQLQKAIVKMIRDVPKENTRQLVHSIGSGTYKFTRKGFNVLYILILTA